MLPPLYAAWMEDLLSGPIPEETRATCYDCAMVPREGDAAAGRLSFHPAAKCCTFLPLLPNFLVGRILEDEDAAGAAGRDTVRERLRRGDAVSPLGLEASRRYGLVYGHSAGFGRTPSMVCPHYVDEEGGLCGVWKHRNGICSTWFCKHVRGADGEAFWHALGQLLTRVEHGLMWWAALQVDPGARAVRELLARRDRGRLSAEEVENGPDPRAYARAWGGWVGREEPFYRECARRVDALSWAEVLAICDPITLALALAVRESYGRLVAPEVPDRLQVGSFRIIQNDGSRVLLDCYREYDPLSVSRTLLQVLPEFDGRPTAEVLAELPRRHGVRLAPELLQRLVDFRVLVSVEE